MVSAKRGWGSLSDNDSFLQQQHVVSKGGQAESHSGLCGNRSFARQHRNFAIFLTFQCRNCDFREEADNPCIYVNKITHEIEYRRNQSPS